DLSERLKHEIDLPAHLAACGIEVRNRKARCPFHDDTEASLSVNFSDGVWVWHCFGCGEGGSIVDFEMKRHGISTGEAISCLAAEYGLAAPQEARPKIAHDSPAVSVEVFKEAIAHVHRASRRSLLDGKAPAATRFLEARGIPREVALRCGLGATHLTKTKYRKLMRWCEERYGVAVKDLGLGGLFTYAKRGLTVLVYPYWPDLSPPDPSCPPEKLPPVKYIKFRPCLSRADAERMDVPAHFRPKGRECSDPWCPLGLPERDGILWLVEGETARGRACPSASCGRSASAASVSASSLTPTPPARRCSARGRGNSSRRGYPSSPSVCRPRWRASVAGART
ncbi:MAG: CHC2 zinc finger domain-containing protein, partial [Planctomycetota bacterium]